MPKIYRSVLAKQSGNQTKVEKVRKLLPFWRQGLVIVRDIQEENIRQGKRIGWIDTKGLPGYLTQRQWKNVNNQVNNDLRSWAALITKFLKSKIFQLDLDDSSKAELFRDNLLGKWWTNPLLIPLMEESLKNNPLPSYEDTNVMLMDGLVAEIQESKHTTSFRKWIRVTIPGEKPVRLPLNENPYADSLGGKEKMVQFIVTEDSLQLRIVRAIEIEENKPKGEIIGIDWGLKNLITTSEGKRYGAQLYEWLLERDLELTALTKSLQANNIPLKNSRRYRRLNQRIRRYVENEVGRIVNLLSKENFQEIVIEDLDFRGGGLSRRLNRVISRAGRRVLRQRLSELSEEKGTKISIVAAPYSSRECSSCGFVAKSNRRTQAIFLCKFCGLKANADVNASKVIKSRRSAPSFISGTRKETVLGILDRRFESRWGLNFDQYSERSTLRSCSRARRINPS